VSVAVPQKRGCGRWANVLKMSVVHDMPPKRRGHATLRADALKGISGMTGRVGDDASRLTAARYGYRGLPYAKETATRAVWCKTGAFDRVGRTRSLTLSNGPKARCQQNSLWKRGLHPNGTRPSGAPTGGGMGAEKTDAVQVAPQNQDRQARVTVRLTADHYQGGRGQG
jgi:hypothetical protein